MKKITIDDIAEAVGVSKTTVSRALSGKGRISDATKKRVIQYAEDHKYKPNVMAKGLAQKCTYNLAVVIPQEDTTSALAFFHNCLVGITTGAEKASYDVLITVERGNRTDELERIIRNSKVDGVILTRTFFEDKRIAYLRKNQVPYVVIGGSQASDVIQVDNDNYGGSLALTDALLKKGISKPALFGGPSEHLVTTQRLQGFNEALSQNGIEEDYDLVFYDTQDEKTMSEDVDKAMAAGADCFFCMDDDIADRALDACKNKGIWVPQQISIASFYDGPVLMRTSPKITAVSFDERMLGEMAAETLIKMIAGDKVSDITADAFELNFRGSTL